MDAINRDRVNFRLEPTARLRWQPMVVAEGAPVSMRLEQFWMWGDDESAGEWREVPFQPMSQESLYRHMFMAMQMMPLEWRMHWCEDKKCNCTGCANVKGKLANMGVTRELWARWLEEHKQE